MAGLSPHELAQFRALFELRRKLSFRRFHGRPQEAIMTLAFLFLALPVPVLLAVLSFTGYMKLPPPWDADLLSVILTLLWLMWLFAPVLGASLNETPDMARLLVLPVQRRVLIASTLAGSVFDYSTFLSAFFLLAAWFGFLGGGTAIVATAAVALAALHLVVSGQLVSVAFAGLARSRRVRDFATVAGGLLLVTWMWINMRSESMAHSIRELGRRAMAQGIHPLDVLQWTPPGACARAIERAASGETGVAVLWLLGSALVLGIATWAWWRALARVTTQGEISMGAPRRHRDRRTRAGARSIRGASRSTVAAVAATDLRLMWRNPRRRLLTFQAFLMPVIFGGIWLNSWPGAGALPVMLPAICMTLFGSYGFTNVLAQDGRGVATIFLSPLDRADFFRGKVLAFTAIAILPGAALCALVAWRAPAGDAVIATLAGASAYVISVAISASVSARFAVRQPEDGKAWRSPGTSAAGWFYTLVQPAAMGAIFGPVWIPVLVGVLTHRTGMAMTASLLGLPYAWLVFRLAMRDAGRAMLAHEPDFHRTLELGRPS